MPQLAPLPSSDDLTTLANVRAYLQKTDTTQDALIAMLITAASRQIMREFEREWAPPVAATLRTFALDDSGWLNLAPYDLRTATLVRIDTNTAAPVTLTTSQYRLWPQPAHRGVVESIHFQPTAGLAVISPTTPSWSRRQVQITGDWGFAGVPADVTHWCNVQVSAWLPGYRSARPLSELEEGENVSRTQALSPAVRWGLASYRRWTFV